MWFLDSRAFNSGTGAGPGPVPEGADPNWVDEDTVPQYIKRESGLMQLLVSGSVRLEGRGDLGADWQFGEVPPALVFVHIPVCLARLSPTYHAQMESC
jgi:hypothetical protein